MPKCQLYFALLLVCLTSSCMEPDMEPIAQQSVFRFFHDHSLPFTWERELSGALRYRDIMMTPIMMTSFMMTLIMMTISDDDITDDNIRDDDIGDDDISDDDIGYYDIGNRGTIRDKSLSMLRF